MMIELNGLTKRCGPVTAPENLTFAIPTGEIFGLLGPNGAGKTTTLRLLAGLNQPDAGSVIVDGMDPWSSSDSVRRMMGVLPRTAVTRTMEQTGVRDLANRRAGKLWKDQGACGYAALGFRPKPDDPLADSHAPTHGLDDLRHDEAGGRGGRPWCPPGYACLLCRLDDIFFHPGRSQGEAGSGVPPDHPAPLLGVRRRAGRSGIRACLPSGRANHPPEVPQRSYSPLCTAS